jgi:exoribonuclease-2
VTDLERHARLGHGPGLEVGDDAAAVVTQAPGLFQFGAIAGGDEAAVTGQMGRLGDQTLRQIGQQPTARLEAVVVRDELVRLAQAPLYLRMPELPAMQLAAGRRIVVDLRDRDELELSVSARFVEFASEAPVDDVELVELEDPLDGVDEVPGPPEAERPVDAEAGLDEPPPAGAQAA